MLRLRNEDFGQMELLEALLPADLIALPADLAKADQWLDDEGFFKPFYTKYHQTMGRPSIPAETYLRLAALKHQYDLSDAALCAFVRDRFSWRRFCRIPLTGKIPHASSLTKIRHRLDQDGSDHMAELNAYLVRKAREEHVIQAKKVRVDTTAVESDTHHPNDASLLHDGVKIVTRLVKQAQKMGAATGRVFRDRTRSVRKRLFSITKVLRRRTGDKWDEVVRITEEMATIAEQSVRQAEAVLEDVRQTAEKTGQKALRHIQQSLEHTLGTCRRVIDQARQVAEGKTHLSERVISLHDRDARPIMRGKVNKKVEFGYKIRLSESEEKIITGYEVLKGNPSDTGMVLPGVEDAAQSTGHIPKEVASDRGGYDKDVEQALKDRGVKRVSIPYRGKKSKRREAHERQAYFRRLQRWRAGQEATISLLKRRFGLRRSRYRGRPGTQRWVGGAVWGHNLWRIAQLI